VSDGRDLSPRTFPAELQGKIIHCDNLADAIILRFAEHAITTSGESPYDKRTLQKIAEIVEKYGEADVAARLKLLDA
jgi:hypothetical protein